MLLLKSYRCAFVPVVAATAFFACRTAGATFYTEKATLDVNSGRPATPSPIHGITQIGQEPGETFTNSYGVNFGTGGINVRTVGIALIADVLNPVSRSSIGGPGSSTTSLAVVFALNGATSAAHPTTATFNAGGFAVFQLPSNDAGTFVPANPSSWGIDFTNPLLIGALAAPTNVTKGNGAPISFAANTVNNSGANSVAANEFQGRTLFDVTSNPNSFVSIDAGALPAGASGPIAFFSTFQENVDAPQPSLNASAKDELNAVAGFFSLSNLGGANTAFADFGSGTATDYNPGGANPINHVGDFSSNLQNLTSYAGLNVVPEPGSLCLLSSGAMIAGLFARRRQSRARRCG